MSSLARWAGQLAKARAAAVSGEVGELRILQREDAEVRIEAVVGDTSHGEHAETNGASAVTTSVCSTEFFVTTARCALSISRLL